MDGGAGLLLVNSGKIVHRKVYGNVAFDAVVPIASASKWLAGAVILSMVDRGELRLDDPVSKYLASITGSKRRITIRQLMSHTSGMAPGSACLDTTATTLRACATEIAALPLAAEPGKSFRYGGASMQLAGRIAEIASKKDWNRLFRERIGIPLQMPNTHFETGSPRLAGGAVSTLDEYGHFVQMLLAKGRYHGRRVLSERAVRAILTDQTRGASLDLTPFAPFTSLDPQVTGHRYGIGGWVESEGIRSSPGSSGFIPWIDVDHNRGGVLLTRAQLGAAYKTYVELKRLLK